MNCVSENCICQIWKNIKHSRSRSWNRKLEKKVSWKNNQRECIYGKSSKAPEIYSRRCCNCLHNYAFNTIVKHAPGTLPEKKSFKVSTLLCANLQLEIDSFNICWIILHQKRMRRKVGRMKMYNNFYLGGGISFKQGTEAVKRREKLLWKLYWSWVGVVVGWRAAVGGVMGIWLKSSERRFVNFRIVRLDFQIIEA